jgi:hypothetical protein
MLMLPLEFNLCMRRLAAYRKITPPPHFERLSDVNSQMQGKKSDTPFSAVTFVEFMKMIHDTLK